MIAVAVEVLGHDQLIANAHPFKHGQKQIATL